VYDPSDDSGWARAVRFRCGSVRKKRPQPAQLTKQARCLSRGRPLLLNRLLPLSIATDTLLPTSSGKGLLVMPEIVLSNAPLLKAISGDLAALRQHVFWVFMLWAALSAVALGIGREVSASIIKIDISKLAPSLSLLAVCLSVAWLYLAGDLTAGSISGYKDRLPLLDLSSARGAATVQLIIELLDGGFGLDAACAIDLPEGPVSSAAICAGLRQRRRPRGCLPFS
jgi:hypothetical protein